MKKKTFIVQLLDSKKPSRTSFTQVEDALFYSNDTDASLVFLPHEDTFVFQSAKVVMFNRGDESLVERDMEVTTEDGRKVASYELPDEIISHWGEWIAQPVFISGGEIYSGAIVPFSVDRHLMHERPPKLTEVVTVTKFVQQSQELVNAMIQAEAQRITEEQVRQNSEENRVQAENERSEKYGSYAQQFNDVIKDLSEEKDYHSLPEISAARGGHETLGARLDETTAQLAKTAQQKIDKNGVGQVSMQNLSQEVKTSMTGGSVAVVGIQSAGLLQLTTDIQEGISTWDELQLVFEDGFYNPDNGQIINDSPDGKRTSVQASEGERFKFTGTVGIVTTGLCFMDSNNDFIANAFPGVDTATPKYEVEIICPENTSSIRISNYSTSATKLWKLEPNFNKFAKSEVVEEVQVKIEEQTSKVKTLFGSNDLNYRDNLKWEIGELSGGIYQPSTTRIRTVVSQAPYDLIVKTQWYSIYVYLWTFDNENMENGTYQLFQGDFVIPKGKWFSLIVRSSADTSIVSDVKTSSLYKYLTIKGLGNPRISSNLHAVAHRGYSTVAPENTIPAFVYAKKVGFDYIELDIDFTSDGEVVCCHDYTIDRTSNGTGTIRNMTLAQLKTYDFGAWKDSIFTGTKIPTLGEALECCKKIGLKVYIDMNASTMTDSEIDQIIDIVKSYRMMNAVTFIGGQPRIERVLVTAPKSRVGFVFYAGSTPLDSIQSIASLKTDDNEIFLNVSYDTLSEALSSACTDAELGLETWTVNYWGNLQSYYKWIDGYTTDHLLPQEAFVSTYY